MPAVVSRVNLLPFWPQLVLLFLTISFAEASDRPRPVSGTRPAALTISRVESTNDVSSLSINVEFEPRDWYFHRVFLDIDNNASSGFSIPAAQGGAEFLIEGEFLYRYAGSGSDWAWQRMHTVFFDLGAGSVRWRLDRSDIGDAFAPNLTAFRVSLQQLKGQEVHSGLYLHHYPVETTPTAQQLGIPAYIWSGDMLHWQRLLATDPLKLDVLVVGVANGPWTAPVPQLVAHVDTARKQGRRVLGYVYTKMGQRNLREVLDDIDKYYRWYRVNGIFVDEGDYSCAHVDYYAVIKEYVYRKAADQRVFLNPGRSFEECMMPNADVFMSFETGATAYLETPSSWIIPPFAHRYPRSRFWHVVHSAPSSQLESIIARSKQLHVGRIWVTSDVLDNPYDTFPEATYYETLLRLATEQAAASDRLDIHDELRTKKPAKRPVPRR